MSKRVVEIIVTPEQSRRRAVSARQTTLTKRRVPLLIVSADVTDAASRKEPAFAVHARHPLMRRSDADLDEAVLNKACRRAGGAGAHHCYGGATNGAGSSWSRFERGSF